jgi:hypothetical protein
VSLRRDLRHTDQRQHISHRRSAEERHHFYPVLLQRLGWCSYWRAKLHLATLRNAVTNTYGDCDRDSYCNSNRDSDAYLDANTDADAYSHGYGYGYGYGYSYSHGYSYSYSHANIDTSSYSDADAYCEAHSHTQTSSHSAASSVIP